MLEAHDHQNRHSAISIADTHDYDVCDLKLSAQATPRQARRRHLADVSPVANPDKHAPVSCPLVPHAAFDSALIIRDC